MSESFLREGVRLVTSRDSHVIEHKSLEPSQITWYRMVMGEHYMSVSPSMCPASRSPARTKRWEPSKSDFSSIWRKDVVCKLPPVSDVWASGHVNSLMGWCTLQPLRVECQGDGGSTAEIASFAKMAYHHIFCCQHDLSYRACTPWWKSSHTLSAPTSQ